MTPNLQPKPTVHRNHFDARLLGKKIAFVGLATEHIAGRDFAWLCDPDQDRIYPKRIAPENPATFVGPLLLTVRTSFAIPLFCTQRVQATQGRH